MEVMASKWFGWIYLEIFTQFKSGNGWRKLYLTPTRFMHNMNLWNEIRTTQTQIQTHTHKHSIYLCGCFCVSGCVDRQRIDLKSYLGIFSLVYVSLWTQWNEKTIKGMALAS